MIDTFHDLETRSPIPIRDGVHRYLERAEVTLWAYAGPDGWPRVWDVINSTDNYFDASRNEWQEITLPPGTLPPGLKRFLGNPEALVWFHNGGMFDFPVLLKTQPWFIKQVPMERWRDTMVQAYAHSMPGALEKLGVVMKLGEADTKMADEGKKLIKLFCIPHTIDEDGTPHYYGKDTHPAEWQRFIVYAARDITTMRVVHEKLPMWNYRGKQVALWHCNLRMNYRGFMVDHDLAAKAIEAAEDEKKRLAKRTQEITAGHVQSTTQRDLLKRILEDVWGVELPDMTADTLERRMEDPDLPSEVKELLGIRLRASMNSPAKYRVVLKATSQDGRLRGCMQWRGASRTGRTGHRLFQPGNLPRPAYPWQHLKELVRALKTGVLDWISDNPMQACASLVRCVIVAPPGRQLVVADLSNIEGRVAAWLAGEDWKLEAFSLYDSIIPNEFDDKGKPKRKGPDLYVVAYCSSFNVPLAEWDGDKAKRQIGKVQELMFQYGGGVGAWITGAATYGIDLDAMHVAVRPVLPAWAVEEATKFLQWLDDECVARRDAALKEATDKDPTMSSEAFKDLVARLDSRVTAEQAKLRLGLKSEVWITCDAIKRLWRRAHPRIESYWHELEDCIRYAIDNPGEPVRARKVVIQRDGSWLRIRLPSGRYLCYPNIHITKGGDIAYTGQNQYTRGWGEITTYGGKVFENLVQAVANDQFEECKLAIEADGFDMVLDVHDEDVCEAGMEKTAERLAELMCSDLGWNAGLPLAAAGFETDRYHKED